MRRIISGLFVLCLATAPVLLSGTAFADSAPANSGGSICGTTWQDVNGDGIHQATEPAIPGVGISAGPGTQVRSDGNGHYCLSGLAAGTYTLTTDDLSASGFGWTIPGQSSKADDMTGKTGAIKVAANQDVDGIDVGYQKSTDDLKPVQLLISINGETKYASDQNWVTTPFHVGDVFQIDGSVEIDGNVADQLGATLTVPDGLTILNTAGGMPSSIVNNHQVVGQFPGRRFADDLEFVGAVVRVDKPFTNGTLKIEAAHGVFDANPNNNTLSEPLSAVAAPAAPTTTTRPAYPTTTHAAAPATTTTNAAAAATTTSNPASVEVTAATRKLPNTGTSIWAPIGLAVGLVLVAAAAFILARRRARQN